LIVSPNLKAFLDMIAHSEGTLGRGDDGYNVLVGGKLFTSYADHPRILVDLGHGLKSTAAGRYQILARYYDAYRKLLHLPDFGRSSQDVIATKMIREQDAMADVEAGRFDAAVQKCANIWASLPGAGYGQHENKLVDLRSAYTRAGGTVT
jgi:muramidase (phage lysozyme)